MPGVAEQRTVQLFPAERRLYEGDYCYVLAENAYIEEEIERCVLIHPSLPMDHAPPAAHSLPSFLSSFLARFVPS